MKKNVDQCTTGIDYFRMSYPQGSGSVMDPVNLDSTLESHQFSVLPSTMSRIMRVLASYDFPVDQMKVMDNGHYGYQNAIRDPLDRFTIYSQLGDSENGILVQFEGLGCSALGPSKVYDLIFDLYKVGAGWLTRIDINVDFLNGTGAKIIDQCSRAYHKGYFGRITCFEPHLKFRNGKEYNHGCGIGVRTSDKFIRAYDKGLESGEGKKGDHVRWETELKGRKARKFGELLFVSDSKPDKEGLSSFLASYSLGEGRVAYRKKSGKYELCRWYADLLRQAQASVLAVSFTKKVKTYMKKKKWYQDSVFPYLKAVGDAHGVSAGTILDYYCTSMESSVDPSDPVVRQGIKDFGEYLQASRSPIIEVEEYF